MPVSNTRYVFVLEETEWMGMFFHRSPSLVYAPCSPPFSRSTYVPEMTDVMLNLTDPEAYFNDIPVDFGPVLFDVMNEMSDNVGDMQFLVGLSMRDPSLKDNVIALAKDAESKLGNRLDAMLLGNEPDLYAGHGERDTYEISDYVSFKTHCSFWTR